MTTNTPAILIKERRVVTGRREPCEERCTSNPEGREAPCSAPQDLDHEIAELEKALAELRADQQRLDEAQASLSNVGGSRCDSNIACASCTSLVHTEGSRDGVTVPPIGKGGLWRSLASSGVGFVGMN